MSNINFVTGKGPGVLCVLCLESCIARKSIFKLPCNSFVEIEYISVIRNSEFESVSLCFSVLIISAFGFKVLFCRPDNLI